MLPSQYLNSEMLITFMEEFTNQDLMLNLAIGLVFVGGILTGYAIGKGWMKSKKKEVTY